MEEKVKECLKCGNETNPHDDTEFFCSQCGAPVVNKCGNYECQAILAGDARYCKLCGSASIFFNYGLFSSILPLSDDELPF